MLKITTTLGSILYLDQEQQIIMRIPDPDHQPLRVMKGDWGWWRYERGPTIRPGLGGTVSLTAVLSGDETIRRHYHYISSIEEVP